MSVRGGEGYILFNVTMIFKCKMSGWSVLLGCTTHFHQTFVCLFLSAVAEITCKKKLLFFKLLFVFIEITHQLFCSWSLDNSHNFSFYSSIRGRWHFFLLHSLSFIFWISYNSGSNLIFSCQALACWHADCELDFGVERTCSLSAVL